MTWADLIVCGSAVVTMNAEREIFLDGGVAVRKDLIIAVGPARDLRARWPHAPVLERPDSIVTPGLINVHQHLTGTR